MGREEGMVVRGFVRKERVVGGEVKWWGGKEGKRGGEEGRKGSEGVGEGSPAVTQPYVTCWDIPSPTPRIYTTLLGLQRRYNNQTAFLFLISTVIVSMHNTSKVDFQQSTKWYMI